jgi:hypothetical protein
MLEGARMAALNHDSCMCATMLVAKWGTQTVLGNTRQVGSPRMDPGGEGCLKERCIVSAVTAMLLMNGIFFYICYMFKK